MNIKLFLYCIVIPISIFCMTSINIERFFRKGRVMQIRIAYLLMSLIVSYLVVNFVVDLYSSFTY